MPEAFFEHEKSTNPTIAIFKWADAFELHIQNQDVDLSRKQIVLRHTKNGKVQVIPLCSAEEIGVNIALFPP